MAKEGEEAGEEEGTAGDCRNGTREEQSRKKKAKKTERKRIENWQERV